MRLFYDWLMEQTYRDDPIGDLAKDAKRPMLNEDFPPPKKATTIGEWELHINMQTPVGGDSSKARETLGKAWNEYLLNESQLD